MGKKRLDVIVVGELNIDLVLHGVPMPVYEKEKLAKDMQFTVGSSSAITAHNLAALGTKVGFVGKVGADTFGRYMIDKLRIQGIETSQIIQDSSLKTGATIVLANPPQKALLTYMGAMTELKYDDIDWDYVRQARHLHLGCYYLQTGILPDVPRIFMRARKFGLTTSLDTNWDPSEQWSEEINAVFEHTDIFFPNEDEARQIAHTHSLVKAIEKLGARLRILVVKRGRDGADVITGRKHYRGAAFNVKAIEATGAGDSFNAGFLHEFLKGSDWDGCLRFGNACGALAVSELGGTTAFQNRSKLRNNLSQLLAE